MSQTGVTKRLSQPFQDKYTAFYEMVKVVGLIKTKPGILQTIRATSPLIYTTTTMMQWARRSWSSVLCNRIGLQKDIFYIWISMLDALFNLAY